MAGVSPSPPLLRCKARHHNTFVYHSPSSLLPYFLSSSYHLVIVFSICLSN